MVVYSRCRACGRIFNPAMSISPFFCSDVCYYEFEMRRRQAEEMARKSQLWGVMRERCGRIGESSVVASKGFSKQFKFRKVRGLI